MAVIMNSNYHSVVKCLVEILYRLFQRIFTRVLSTQIHFKVMYVVKADHPETKYNISADVVDSEGNVIEATELDWEVTTDNPDAVEIVPDDDNNPTTGAVKFGSPGTANVNITASYKGNILGSFGAQFTVTTGDPSAIANANITFEGLSEETPEPEV